MPVIAIHDSFYFHKATLCVVLTTGSYWIVYNEPYDYHVYQLFKRIIVVNNGDHPRLSCAVQGVGGVSVRLSVMYCCQSS